MISRILSVHDNLLIILFCLLSISLLLTFCIMRCVDIINWAIYWRIEPWLDWFFFWNLNWITISVFILVTQTDFIEHLFLWFAKNLFIILCSFEKWIWCGVGCLLRNKAIILISVPACLIKHTISIVYLLNSFKIETSMIHLL